MKFSAAGQGDGLAVSAYAPGEIRIGERRFSRSLLLTPRQLIQDWGPDRVDDLQTHHVQAIADLQPQVVILGTGERQRFPAPRLFLLLIDLGIGHEVMTTAAACRTYNLLMAEGRAVVGAFILPGD